MLIRTFWFISHIDFRRLKNISKATSDLMKENDRKNIVTEFFKFLVTGKFKEGLRFFAPDCKTHNPYVNGSIEALTDAMIAASKDLSGQGSEMEFKVRQVLADGDFVAAYINVLNNKSKPGEGGLRQIHLFRFENDKIVEYWDVTQQIMNNMPNAGGAF